MTEIRNCPMEQTREALGGLTGVQAIDQIWPVFKRVERLQWTILGIVAGWGIREVLLQFGVTHQEALAAVLWVLGRG